MEQPDTSSISRVFDATLITDQGLRYIAGHEHLIDLSLGPLITDAGLAVLRELPAFTDASRPGAKLSLAKCPFIGDEGLKHVGALAGLERLELCESRLTKDRWVSFLEPDVAWPASYTGAGLAPLRHLPHLRDLCFSGEKMDDDALEHVGQFLNLTSLACGYAVSGDRGWEGLSKSQSIETLSAFCCHGMTGMGLRALAAMPRLSGLELGSDQIRDADLAALEDFETMTAFGTHRGNVFTDAAFQYITRAPALEKLGMGYARTMSDAATIHIARAPHLKSIHMGGWRMGDRSCELLAEAPALEHVRLHTRRLTDAGLAHLNRAPHLRQVEIDACPFVTVGGVGTLRDEFDVDYSPATPRQIIEVIVDDEQSSEQAIAVLASHGAAARDELSTFVRISPEALRPTFRKLLDQIDRTSSGHLFPTGPDV